MSGRFGAFGAKTAFRGPLNSAFSAKRAETSLPPGTPTCHPDVVPVFEPAQRRHEVERAEQGPAAPELPQHPADGRRTFELPPVRLHRPNRPADLVSADA